MNAASTAMNIPKYVKVSVVVYWILSNYLFQTLDFPSLFVSRYSSFIAFLSAMLILLYDRMVIKKK
ncbi:MAG: hypothetical protein IH819_10635 [Bacteroidetes bacterium]|nr:hypothetical protein [Bacteroidota bacterium]